MISDTALGEACRPAVLGRARVIARSRDGIWKRVCSYDGPVTCLSARVASTSGDGETYVTTISFDESTDVVHDYSCTCPAARRFSGACKHSIALALAFNKDTESFTGYDRLFHVSTSPALLAFLGRDASAVRLRPTGDTAEQPGTVSLVPVIMRDHGINLRALNIAEFGDKKLSQRVRELIRSFQQTRDLPADGKIDLMTILLLNASGGANMPHLTEAQNGL